MEQPGLPAPVVQAAINVSDGRRPDVIAAVLDAAGSVHGAVVADWSADPDHNRMVVTLLGGPQPTAEAVLALARVAVRRIDLREHTGVHPRIGALDVVPFTPIRGVTMAECVTAAVSLGAALADELALPVYLYEEAARPGRARDLPSIRSGGYEALAAGPLDGGHAPDLGPPRVHPSAGAVVVGARSPLVAYNVQLAATDPGPARDIAAAIRKARSCEPALTGVRAMGVALASRGLTQVSMNVTEPHLTPLPPLFDFVAQHAARHGTRLVASEVIGLLPRGALAGQEPERIIWWGARQTQFVEWWLEHGPFGGTESR